MPAQVLRSNPATITATFVDTAGALVDPGVTSVVVTNLAGVEVASGNATGTGAAARTYTLTVADTATLDTLAVAFDPATAGLATITERVEVVGALLFTEAEARAFDGGAMTNPTTYPDAVIQEARARITDQFETICGVSFVPRYRLDVVSGSGFVNMALPRMKVTSIRSVEYRSSGAATWTAYDATDLADLYIEDYGWVLRETRGLFTLGRRNLRIGYEHGFTTPPYDIKRAALMTLRYELVDSNYSDRTISVSNEFGSTQLWTPNLSGRGSAIHPLPEVDRILRLYLSRIPVVA